MQHDIKFLKVYLASKTKKKRKSLNIRTIKKNYYSYTF